MDAITTTIAGSMQSSQPMLIRNCGVPLDTVESAVLSRRIGSANVVRLQGPINAANAPQRGAASADVARRREQMQELTKSPATVIKSNFRKSTPLTHLGIDLNSLRPKTATTAKDVTSPVAAAAAKSNRPSSCSTYDQLRKTVSDLGAIHAVNAVVPHIVEQTPYLQHLRDRAHAVVKEEAAAIRGEAAGGSGAPVPLAEMIDVVVGAKHEKLFAEWTTFLGKCDKEWFESLPESDRQQLFTKFTRSRGRMLPHNPSAVAEARVKQMLEAADNEPLDELAAPSGAPPAVLPPIKMMMHASSKRAFHEHLVEQATLSSSRTQQPVEKKKPQLTPVRVHSARLERFEEKKIEVQQQAQEVFTSTVDAQRRHQRDFALRTAISHAAHNLRLHQRGNVSFSHNAAVSQISGCASPSPSSADSQLRTPSPTILDHAATKKSCAF